MIENDTVRLLRECSAGIKMGVSSIDDVLPKVKSRELSRLLSDSKDEHERLEQETNDLLNSFGDSGKEPNPIAKGMSWMKTTVKLDMDKSDSTVADLITDGCNMGVKSLNRYLNQYKAADERSKDISKKLINMEATLAQNLRCYL